MIGLYYEKIIGSGGAQTLLLRMAQWLRQNNYDFCVLTYIMDDSNIATQISKVADVTVFSKIGQSSFQSTIWTKFAQKDDVIITFSFDAHIKVRKILDKGHLKCHNLLYLIHRDGLKCLYSRRQSHSFTVKLLKKSISLLLKAMAEHHSLIFMDKISWGDTCEYYHLDKFQINPKIICLPMYIRKTAVHNDRASILHRWGQNNNIITVARADFPFKGYVIGLVMEFIAIKKEIHTISLTIITSSKTSLITEIEKTLGISEKNLTSLEIEIYENIDYQELGKYYGQAVLSLGMGTSVLDAANYCVPTLIVKPYTYELKILGYFSDMPDTIAVSENSNIRDERNNKLETYVRRISMMNLQEYLNICVKTKDSLDEYYDINKNMQDILDFAKHSSRYKLTPLQSLYWSLRELYRKKRMN